MSHACHSVISTPIPCHIFYTGLHKIRYGGDFCIIQEKMTEWLGRKVDVFKENDVFDPATTSAMLARRCANAGPGRQSG